MKGAAVGCRLGGRHRADPSAGPGEVGYLPVRKAPALTPRRRSSSASSVAAAWSSVKHDAHAVMGRLGHGELAAVTDLGQVCTSQFGKLSGHRQDPTRVVATAHIAVME